MPAKFIPAFIPASPTQLANSQTLMATALTGFQDQASLMRIVQQGLATHIWQGDANTLVKRLALYRGNIRATHIAALQAQFPIVAQLVGDEFFAGLVDHYRHQHPTLSGDISDVGQSFSEFLQHFQPAAHLPYLADVAQLEWAIHQAEQAINPIDTCPLDFHTFVTQHAANLGDQRLQLAAGAQRIASAYALYDIWQLHQPQPDQIASSTSASANQPAPTQYGAQHSTQPCTQHIVQHKQAQTVLVYRPHYRAYVFPLQAHESALIQALMQQQTLEQALLAAQNAMVQDAMTCAQTDTDTNINAATPHISAEPSTEPSAESASPAALQDSLIALFNAGLFIAPLNKQPPDTLSMQSDNEIRP